MVLTFFEHIYNSRMQRKKGQFTSSKAINDEAGAGASDWNGGNGQDEETL